MLEDYQKRQNESLEGLHRVQSIINDIWGENMESAVKDHDENVSVLMQHYRDSNLKSDKDKLILKKKQIRSVGHKISDQGLNQIQRK